MNLTQLLAQLLFSETKDTGDAIAIAWATVNRLNRPERFGETLEDVIYSPDQFSGVNNPEWNKVTEGKLTSQEEAIYKKFLQISSGVLRKTISDPTGGADHYFNPKLASPSWAKKMQRTYQTKFHDYYSELGNQQQNSKGGENGKVR